MEQETKPALRVVAGNPRLNFPRPASRRPGDDVPIILPEINIFAGRKKWLFECELLGLTDWQRNRAWQLVARSEDKSRYESYRKVNNWVFLLWQALAAALDHERREVLAILQEHHPARWHDAS